MTGLGIGHARAQRACHPGALPSTEAGRKRLSRTHEAAWKQGEDLETNLFYFVGTRKTNCKLNE